MLIESLHICNMSRVGRQPILIPKGVEVAISEGSSNSSFKEKGQTITISGNKGNMCITLSPCINCCIIPTTELNYLHALSLEPSFKDPSCNSSSSESVSETDCQKEASHYPPRTTKEKSIFRALQGLSRTLLQNMVTGVHHGFEKKLKLTGVGFRAEVVEDKDGTNKTPRGSHSQKKLVLMVGYSHPVEISIPHDIKVTTENPTTISVSGISREQVGLFAANIRSKRPPEPYKGKGISYVGEFIRRKAVKANK